MQPIALPLYTSMLLLWIKIFLNLTLNLIIGLRKFDTSENLRNP